MPQSRILKPHAASHDLIAGLVVFLVALPLCLGIALASGAPPIAGIVTGIIGGIVVGLLSGSQTSVSGPAAGLTAVVSAEIAGLGSFETFLAAVIIGGGFQCLLGLLRAGGLSAFIPSSVIKGLLAAIGLILILKQVPHLVGHDTDPDGEMSFLQPDKENTFSEFGEMIYDLHWGAALIGALSLAMLIAWDRIAVLKKSIVPPQLAIVVFGVAAQFLLQRVGGRWDIGATHLVEVPVASTLHGLLAFLEAPPIEAFGLAQVWRAGLVVAVVASLETLLNLEAVDKLDPYSRLSPPNRELIAQGCGNMLAGLVGGLPMTSVIIRSSVNIHAGAQTKLSAIVHGVLLLGCVVFIPELLNHIPLSCLAAILIVTGYKLASPKLIAEMWSGGRSQFLPFAVTVLAIVFTNLLDGVLIGLAVSVAFILNSNLRRPLRRSLEKHIGGDVLHIYLPEQVTFLNRAALEETLHEAPRGIHVLLDAQNTDYIDPDVLSLIREFHDNAAEDKGVTVSLLGFRNKYQLSDQIHFIDYTTQELQGQLSPNDVLRRLKDGNERFRTGQRLTRDLGRQVSATATGQHPLAVVLSCIDSRSPAELIFDTGLGDLLNVRVAGNVTSPKVLGSIEYSCAVAGARLVLVMGHTRCGAVGAAVKDACSSQSVAEMTGCGNLQPILEDIRKVIDDKACRLVDQSSADRVEEFVDEVAERNVEQSVARIRNESARIRALVEAGRVAIVGCMYDVSSGEIRFLNDAGPTRT